ncbi:MAG: C25 family cysteine peptidase [Bacteroidota bacterium]
MIHSAKLFVILLLLPFLAFSQAGNDKDVNRKITDRGLSGLDVTYDIENFSITTQTIENTTFHALRIRDFSFLPTEGKPALPAHRDLVLIPEGVKAEIHVNKSDPDTFYHMNILPTQPPHADKISDEDNSTEPDFVIDKKFYSQNTEYPIKLVSLNQNQKIRNLRTAVVQISPFQYNPAKQRLIVYRKISYTIHYPGASNYFKNIQRYSDDYLHTLPSKFLNASSINKEIGQKKSQTKTNTEDYLIITHSDFVMAADSLAHWKQQLGHQVKIIKKSNWHSSEVKDSIHYFYHNAAIYPDYFVILGDHEFVPAELVYSAGNRYSDLYYACMDSVSGGVDYYPDMAHGRISVSSSAEAISTIQKIIEYESSPPSSASFYEHGLNCAYFQDDDTSGYASRRFVHSSEEVLSYLNTLNYNINRVYYTDPYVTPTHFNDGYYSDGQAIPPVLLRSNGYAWDGDGDDVIQEINNGKFYVLHRDHGYSGGWSEPDFSSSDIPFLTNAGQLPVVFSINCSSGNFIKDECFAEKLLRKSQGGAVGVVAASNTSYSGSNDGFTIGLFDAIWANPGLIPDFGSGGVSNPLVNPHGNIRQMGHVVNHGLLRMIQTWNDSKATHELMHYHGDPAMQIWTAQPTPVTATHQDTLFCDSTSLAVLSSNAPNAQVTLLQNGVLLDKIQLSGNGTGTLSFSNITNIKPYATLTISKEGMQPYISRIPVAGCTYTPVAQYNIMDTSISCFKAQTFLYDISLYSPTTRSWSFDPPTVNYISGNSHSKQVQVAFSDTGYYDVQLNVSNAFGSDSIITQNSIYVYPSLPAPITENAEQFAGFGLSDTVWQARGNSTYSWHIHQDSTPSFTTGPIVDHTSGTSQGHFFYTEASSGNANDTAILTSPALNINTLTTPALSFWYHMFGAHINVLHIDISTGGGNWQTIESISGQQQTGYNKAWKQAYVDLGNYSGECIKIRFRAIRGNGYKGDIALDDIAIMEYDQSPQANIKLNTNYACVGHSIQFEDKSCCGVSSREWYFPGGTPGFSTLESPVVTYDTAGNYNVILKVTNPYGTDSLVEYYSIVIDENQPLPLTEDFETFYPGNPGTFYNNWHTDKTDDYQWMVNQGGTASSATGPVFDHTTGTTSGIYVYTEASYVSEGEEAYLYTPCISIPAQEQSFVRLYSHLYGSGIDTIHLDVFDGQQWYKDIFSFGGQQQHSQTEAWKKITANISSLKGKDVRFRFRSKRTNSYTDDKAIDDISFFNGGMKIIQDTIDLGDFYTVKGIEDSIHITNLSPDTIFLQDIAFPPNYYGIDSLPPYVLSLDTIAYRFYISLTYSGDYTGYTTISSSLNTDSVFLTASAYLDINSLNKKQNLRIYPNPATDHIFISTNKHFINDQYEITILNIHGQRVLHKKKAIHKSMQYQLHMGNLKPGVYFIQLKSSQELYNQRIIKE